MKTQSKIIILFIGLAVFIGSTLPAYAIRMDLSGTEPAVTKTAVNKTDAAKIVEFQDKADREINRRIDALNKLNSRIQSMKKITEAQKASLKTGVQGQIDTLTDLKAKIDANTDLASLRIDVQSIAKSYRIFMLVIPQGAAIAAADRALTVADTMTVLGAKLQTRISAAKTAGKNVSSMETLLTDYNAKISDARKQAQAAITLISSLTPDNGDKVKMAANTKALKDAHAKIQLAQKDFVAARKDARDIVQTLKTLGDTTKNAKSVTETDS